ncbi:hypothetical protein AB6A40_011099 [Gnathostoma spinigerum]|uniref:Uncharacterized protein n=1 Tax=Gnathostoma spinigerum TaxID=75299 RepID=A0ABD6F4A4_9BILA
MEFVSTYVPHQSTYANDPPFIGYCDGHLSHKESINTGGPYAHLHVYPYIIPVFNERLSLNKKKRWLTSGGLKSKVGTYEDDERKIRVSFVRSVMSHIERKSNNGGEIKEVLPRKDVEVITASKLGIKHWQNVRTNHTDLLRQPMPPKRISGHGNSNYSDVCEDSMLGEEYLHIVYTETTHRVSKKEASKLQRCERNEKKKIRRQYVTPQAKCKAVSAGEYFKEYSEDMKFIDDYEGIDDHPALIASGSRENTLKDFIVDRPSKRFRMRRLKVKAECPEYYYPSQMPNNTDDENFNDSAENPLNNIHFPYPDPLPSCTVVLEEDLESNHQVMQLMASANKIMRFSPETFILHSARDNCFLGCGLTEKFQGYVSFCLATECSASGTLQRVIRLTFNSTEERKPETRPEKQKIATPIDFRHILPADCFLSADCSEENDCRKAAVDNWLRTINDVRFYEYKNI